MSGSADNEYVEFRVDDTERFQALCSVFGALKADKEKGAFRDDKEWLALFDEAALSHFWWPTEEERLEYQKLWDETP